MAVIIVSEARLPASLTGMADQTVVGLVSDSEVVVSVCILHSPFFILKSASYRASRDANALVELFCDLLVDSIEDKLEHPASEECSKSR